MRKIASGPTVQFPHRLLIRRRHEADKPDEILRTTVKTARILRADIFIPDIAKSA
jgi:hypothetical protein